MTSHPVHSSLSLLFTGILTDYSRIRAHTMNLHEVCTDTAAVAAG